MGLLTFHKILIATTFAFFTFFGIREITRANGSPLLGAASLLLSVGLAVYFIWVVKGGYGKK